MTNVEVQLEASTRNAEIEDYLGQLDSALSGIAFEQKRDILSEIRAHVVDSAAVRGGDVGGVLRSLGSPKDLAERYRTEAFLAQASHSYSPWLLLQTAWRWSTTGVKGIAVFLLAVFGYGTAVTLTISLLLKPFVPSIGLWVGRGTVEVGNPAKLEGLHELAGHWYVPLFTVVAFAIALGTTHALRWLMRLRRGRALVP